MVLGGILCGMIADKWQCHRKVITTVCLISMVAITAKPLVSVYYGNQETNQRPSSIIEEHSAGVNMNATLKAIACINNTNQNLNCTKNIKNSKSNYDSQTLCIIMLFINICLAFCEGAGLPFVDTSTLRRKQLASKDRPVEYGRQRMFTGIGAIIGIGVTYFSTEYFPTNNKITCFAGIFIVYGIFTFLFGLFTWLSYRGLSFGEMKEEGQDKEIGSIDYTENRSENENFLPIPNELKEISSEPAEKIKASKTFEIKNEQNFMKNFCKTIFQLDTLFFLLTTFISGLQYSQFTSFLFVYLKELGAPSILLTLSIALAALTATVFLAYFEKIIQLLGGKWRSMMVSFFMYAVRYFGISWIENPWLVLIFQSLHGVTFSVYVTAGLQHLNETIPTPMLTSMISIFNSIHYGLGTTIGFIISGEIYQRYGGRALYRYTALLSIVWCIVLGVYVCFKERRERKEMNMNKEVSV